MQISRHWRLNAQRYRLEGIRYPNGEVTLQERPLQTRSSTIDDRADMHIERQTEKQTVPAA